MRRSTHPRRQRGTVSSLLAAIVFAGAVTLGWESVALADVPPPDSEGCSSGPGTGSTDLSKAGTACQTDNGASGKCTTSKCQKLDYANWDRDASMAPPSVEYDCLRCTAGAATSSEAGATSGDSGAPAPTSTGSNSSSGCSVSSSARSAAPWLLAVAAALAVTARRKRSQA